MYIRLGFIFLLILFSNFLFSQGSGNVLSFNGTSTYINLGNEVGSDIRTIECWFKPATTINSGISDAISLIMRDFENGSSDNQNEYGFYFTPDGWFGLNGGALVFYRRVGSTPFTIQSNNIVWEQNKWYHIAGVIYPNSGMKMYVNGVLQTQTHPSTYPILAQTGSIYDYTALGTWGYWGANANKRFFNGDIDEIRFWSNARTQSEIREKMCSKLIGNESGLKAYYQFDNSSGTTLSESINGFHGTLNGFSTTLNPWHYSSAPIGDTSVYVYPNTFSGTSHNLTFNIGDEFNINNITALNGGAHIYRVNTLPNSIIGLNSNVNSSYYGVFLTDFNSRYDFNYDASSYSNCVNACSKLYSRNDNDDLNWLLVNSTNNNCIFSKTNESANVQSYREEYIISTSGSDVQIGNDTTICKGDTIAINSGISSPAYCTWNNGSHDPEIFINSAGLYWLEVNTNGCIDRDSLFITEISPPIIQANDTAVFCIDSLILNAGVPTNSYLWNTGDTSSSLIITQPGTYLVTSTNNGCSSSKSITVTSNNTNDTIIEINACNKVELKLSAPIIQNGIYNWSTGDSSTEILIHENGQYELNVTKNNCLQHHVYFVKGLEAGGGVYIPNSFTPNKDQLNEVFMIQSEIISNYELQIFNKWGELIFTSEKIDEGWNGKLNEVLCQEDTYIYVLNYEVNCEPEIKKQKRGIINLIR
jgi:gliding motility-associated-like protein